MVCICQFVFSLPLHTFPSNKHGLSMGFLVLHCLPNIESPPPLALTLAFPLLLVSLGWLFIFFFFHSLLCMSIIVVIYLIYLPIGDTSLAAGFCHESAGSVCPLCIAQGSLWSLLTLHNAMAYIRPPTPIIALHCASVRFPWRHTDLQD